MIQERGAAQFRYGNTPLSCGGREQNVQEKRDATRLSVIQTDRQTDGQEKGGMLSLIKLKIQKEGQLLFTVNKNNTHSSPTPTLSHMSFSTLTPSLTSPQGTKEKKTSKNDSN